MDTHSTARPGGNTIKIEQWPSELALGALVVVASIGIWILLFISVIGIMYGAISGVFFFLTHIGFISYLRGSAIRIGPNQFPELHDRIQYLSSRAGLPKAPEAYLMQSGGTLNALATKLLRSNFIVLYSDLLNACDDNTSARDMIIGHELGHINEKHLSFVWFLLPGLMFPFLGSAYSRAREYTCDRYGYALSANKNDALRGLAILAAGAEHGPKVNLQEFVGQRKSLNTGLMVLGKLLATHPPLCERIAVLEPSLAIHPSSLIMGYIRAALIMILFIAVFVSGFWFIFSVISKFSPMTQNSMYEFDDNSQFLPPGTPSEMAAAKEKVDTDLIMLADFIEEIRLKTGNIPDDDLSLASIWGVWRPDQPIPIDPLNGYYYGYYRLDDEFVIYSAGLDGAVYTEDDISYYSGDTADVMNEW